MRPGPYTENENTSKVGFLPVISTILLAKLLVKWRITDRHNLPLKYYILSLIAGIPVINQIFGNIYCYNSTPAKCKGEPGC
jgi:hypothetical protein